jgi:hypothetical protein
MNRPGNQFLARPAFAGFPGHEQHHRLKTSIVAVTEYPARFRVAYPALESSAACSGDACMSPQVNIEHHSGNP